jgi:hypothetical protein
MSEYDSPWKEALDRFLRNFLEFFFPHIAADIAWERGYEVLDKELEQIDRAGEIGNRLADKLFKVWRINGQETWLLIHVEIQAQPDQDFPERMYVYNYRIYDCYRRPVVSLALLGDDRRDWRPTEFGYNVWDCEVRLRFLMKKLLDYSEDLAMLEAHLNPIALIVLAHLQSMATRDHPGNRKVWKVRLIKGLLDRGLNAADIRQLFKMIDWLLELPEELAKQFDQEIEDYEKEKKMEYVTSVERHGIEKGREQGRREAVLELIAVGLERFGTDGRQLLPAVSQIADMARLLAIHQTVYSADELDAVRELLPAV